MLFLSITAYVCVTHRHNICMNKSETSFVINVKCEYKFNMPLFIYPKSMPYNTTTTNSLNIRLFFLFHDMTNKKNSL